jgi:hypothetical protein
MAIFPISNVVTLATAAVTYQANNGDFVIAPAALAAACVVTLPPVSTGTTVAVKNLSTTPRLITVETADSSKIDGIAGATGIALAAQWDSFVLVCDGANWYSLSGSAVVAAS